MIAPTLTMAEMDARIVRYGELRPCKIAFIDAHTPGSDQKENFTIIGGGLSESPDQDVHIREPLGFNIGAAGLPPKCRNSLHSHRSAEVFCVLKGRWRFFWGHWGTAGEFVAEEDDPFDIPTGIFRAFESIGTDYGMIMAVLSGDDAGGGVIWAPQVITDAKDYGLILGKNGKSYNSTKGVSLPEGVPPMLLLTEEALKSFPEPTTADVVPNCFARYQDLMALPDRKPAKVIGAQGKLRDRPGFEVELLSRNSIPATPYTLDRGEVLMPMRRYWRLTLACGSTVLNPGDTAAIPPGFGHSLAPFMTGESSLYRVIGTEDEAGLTGRLL